MLPVARRVFRRLTTVGLLLGVLPLLASCVDGPSALELPRGDQVALLAVAPHYVPLPQSGDAAPVNRIRIRARAPSTAQVVGETVVDVDPGAQAWDVGLEVRIPAGLPPQVILTVELINVSGGVETVEWSGEVGPIEVTPGGETTVANVEVGRGPPDNLSVTSVTIDSPPAVVRIGRSAQLTASTTVSSSGGNPTVFWSSLDPAVATVTEGGLIQGVSKGTARVVAAAGLKADTASIPVAPALASIRISPSPARLESLGEEVQLSAVILDTEGNPAQGEGVTWSSLHPQLLQSVGGGRFRALANGSAQAVATSSSEPTLSQTAPVAIRQVATSVSVTPDSVTVTEVGQPVTFTAAAFDALDNRVADASFEWESTDSKVASVTQTGLATSMGGGRTEIQAWVLEPAGSAGGGDVGAPGDRTGVVGSAVFMVELPYTIVVTPPDTLLESIGEAVRLSAYARTSAGDSLGATARWSSADTSIARVDSLTGLVTAVKDGSTSILATLVSVSPVAGGEGTPPLAPASASANITVRQRAVAVRWVVQPSDLDLTNDPTAPFDPPPAVEAVDALKHRVPSFQGNIFLQAMMYDTLGSVPPGGSSPGPDLPEGPQRNVSYSSVAAVDGVATFTGLGILDVYGYYRFTLLAYGSGLASAESDIFWVYGYGT